MLLKKEPPADNVFRQIYNCRHPFRPTDNTATGKKNTISDRNPLPPLPAQKLLLPVENHCFRFRHESHRFLQKTTASTSGTKTTTSSRKPLLPAINHAAFGQTENRFRSMIPPRPTHPPRPQCGSGTLLSLSTPL